MARKKQEEFFLPQHKSWMGKSFGGVQTSHPKTKRPFSSRHLIHLILKSSQATGRKSFLHHKNRKMVDHTVRSLAKKSSVRIYDYVNVGNHLHLLIKASDQDFLTRFLRALGGVLPRKICGCERGQPLGFQFWDGRPFTKVVAAGLRPFHTLKRYFGKNLAQAQTRVEGFDFQIKFSSA